MKLWANKPVKLLPVNLKFSSTVFISNPIVLFHNSTVTIHFVCIYSYDYSFNNNFL